ncbi:DUF4159 domain-containing protein, partial [Fibrobacterota bacterium]
MRLIIYCLVSLSLALSDEGGCWSIARLKYSGGGDWYSDPSGLPNLIARIKKDLKADVCGQEKTVSLLDAELFTYPILYMTGHGNVSLSEEEKKVLREYLYHGGLLFADDNYGMDSSFRREVRDLFKGQPLHELPQSHPVFSSYHHFPGGLPKIHQHNGKRPQLFGIDLMERTVVLYTYESDLGDGWENPEVHKAPPHLREKA